MVQVQPYSQNTNLFKISFGNAYYRWQKLVNDKKLSTRKSLISTRFLIALSVIRDSFAILPYIYSKLEWRQSSCWLLEVQKQRVSTSGPGGHSLTKHTGGLARRSESKAPKYPSKNSSIKKMLKSCPLNIFKVQSESSKISNLGQIFIFTEKCTP